MGDRARRRLDPIGPDIRYDPPNRHTSCLLPSAGILAEIGLKWENAATRAKLARWFWCGIFGELYGSAIESRSAKDVQEVPAWVDGGEEPDTVREGMPQLMPASRQNPRPHGSRDAAITISRARSEFPTPCYHLK